MPRVHRYGPGPDQFLELTLPDADVPAPVVVVVHGGFWRPAYGIELARPLAADLAGAGFAAVAVEYRRVGEGGGWPGTLEDVAAALDCLPGIPDAARLDLTDVTAVGHSAGGHLAAWLAGRHRLPAGAPGAAPRVRVTAAVLQAGVLDLAAAARPGAGQRSRARVPGRRPRRAAGALRRRRPGAAAADGRGRPLRARRRRRRRARGPERALCDRGAAAGDRVELRVVPGDHMMLIDPASPAWATVRAWLAHGRSGAPYA